MLLLDTNAIKLNINYLDWKSARYIVLNKSSFTQITLRNNITLRENLLNIQIEVDTFEYKICDRVKLVNCTPFFKYNIKQSKKNYIIHVQYNAGCSVSSQSPALLSLERWRKWMKVFTVRFKIPMLILQAISSDRSAGDWLRTEHLALALLA
jgi:hypothetical protein